MTSATITDQTKRWHTQGIVNDRRLEGKAKEWADICDELEFGSRMLKRMS